MSGGVGKYTPSPWRSIGRYRKLQDWVRALKGKSGVYLIRQRITNTILYIGESHTARLYETLTRHFQAWEGRTAGPVFTHDTVEVRVIVTTHNHAKAVQDDLICEHNPPRNRVNPCESVPF